MFLLRFFITTKLIILGYLTFFYIKRPLSVPRFVIIREFLFLSTHFFQIFFSSVNITKIMLTSMPHVGIIILMEADTLAKALQATATDDELIPIIDGFVQQDPAF